MLRSSFLGFVKAISDSKLLPQGHKKLQRQYSCSLLYNLAASCKFDKEKHPRVPHIEGVGDVLKWEKLLG